MTDRDVNNDETENLEKKYDEPQEVYKCSMCETRRRVGTSKAPPPTDGCSNGGKHSWSMMYMLDIYGRKIPGYGEEGGD